MNLESELVKHAQDLIQSGLSYRAISRRTGLTKPQLKRLTPKTSGKWFGVATLNELGAIEYRVYPDRFVFTSLTGDLGRALNMPDVAPTSKIAACRGDSASECWEMRYYTIEVLQQKLKRLKHV